jgi:hypothetical protein
MLDAVIERRPKSSVGLHQGGCGSSQRSALPFFDADSARERSSLLILRSIWNPAHINSYRETVL